MDVDAEYRNPLDLNNLIPANSGWDLQSANAIATNGKIVGAGLHNGQGSQRKGRTTASQAASVINMVARDGVEPPTPAFSGLRSTT